MTVKREIAINKSLISHLISDYKPSVVVGTSGVVVGISGVVVGTSGVVVGISGVVVGTSGVVVGFSGVVVAAVTIKVDVGLLEKNI